MGGDHAVNGNDSEMFFTGVIEGFYNRPWTVYQRLDLFKKLNKYKMNSYLYAPKDDAKHRAKWRDPYTNEECQDIKKLIDSCKQNNVIFFYGISPGLDIKYSDENEIKLLHNKCKQIKDLGCEGFAILWDDIEPELNKEDEKHFRSFSDAHCQVSNELYQFLQRPKFLFCPVEYCASRSVPNVKESEYLQTIGKQLEKNIHVFWTGSMVVSEVITVKECQVLTDVIKRKPIIWDNIHANDYDHQRMYLGPYLGRERSVSPSKYLSGAMTNPNCEYSLNIPAMVTLADWANNKKWDVTGQQSHKLAVKEFLQETAVASYAADTAVQTKSQICPEDQLKEGDVDLLFQMFWLPHSHGPKIQELLENFKFCKDNAAVVRGWKKFDVGEQPEIIDVWMDKATAINNVCKQFFNTCDKLTYISNRELLYDLNSYINNVRIILHACNNYLKWIGIDDCRKPIKHGPTLAGLPGGLAGDLMRLYPIQSNSQYPIKNMVTAASSSLTVLPYNLSLGKLNKQLEQLFDVEFKTFSELLASSKNCVIVQQNKTGAKSEICGLIASWPVSQLAQSSSNDLCSRFFSKMLKCPTMSEKYSLVIKIFAASPVILDEALLGSTFEAFKCSADPEDVILVANEKNESLVRFLKLKDFTELKTDCLISGQDLLCKSV